MPRAALYARVSTAEQTVDPQLHALREYARARGVEVVEEYVDQGVSGSRDQRPALDRLLKDARRRRFDDGTTSTRSVRVGNTFPVRATDARPFPLRAPGGRR